MNVHSLSNRGSFLEQGRCQACRRFLRVAVEAGGLLRGFEMVEFATSFFLRAATTSNLPAGELNSRPIPKAFGACSKLLEVENCQMRILL